MIKVRCLACVLLAMLAHAPLVCAQNDTQPSLFSPEATPIEDWQARLELATLLTNTGQYGEAAAEYRRILDEKPENQRAKVGLARVLMWSGRQAEAGALLAGISGSCRISEGCLPTISSAE